MPNGPLFEDISGRSSVPGRNASVAAVVVTYNPDSAAFTRVLQALADTSVHLLIILDNGSGNAEEVGNIIRQSALRKAEYLPQKENLGIAAAQNIGIRRAIDAGCSHVMFFDQDSRPSSDMVDNLLDDEAKLTAAGKRIAAIGPNLRDSRSGSLYPQARIRGPLLRKVWIDPNSDAPVEVSFIIASGSLIRVPVLQQVGFMNEDFFIDRVDLEWCLRARAQGFSSFVSSRAIMAHSIGDHRTRSLGRELSIHSPERSYYMARNSIMLTRMPWVPAGYKMNELFRVFIRTADFLFAVNFRWNYTMHISKGIIHGFKGQGGRYKQ